MERAYNKLARTFASQVEALKRYRTGGEQKLTVENVSVKDGGQAIVGNVEAIRMWSRTAFIGKPRLKSGGRLGRSYGSRGNCCKTLSDACGNNWHVL